MTSTQVACGALLLFVFALVWSMVRENNKRKKKKGTGLIVVCVTQLNLLFAVLIILIWQISRVGNGETVGFGGKTGNTQAVSQNTPSVMQEAAPTSSSGSEANGEEAQTQAQTEAAQAESADGQTQAAGQATMLEPQTYENDANGNMIVPARQVLWKQSLHGNMYWKRLASVCLMMLII